MSRQHEGTHFILVTPSGTFLIDGEKFQEIRKLRQKILRRQRSEDIVIICFFVLLIGIAGLLYLLFGSDEPLGYWLFNFLESAIVTCGVISERGNVPLDKVIAIVIVVFALGYAPLLLWSTRLRRRNGETFEVTTMLESEIERHVREHNANLKEIQKLKQQSEEKDRQAKEKDRQQAKEKDRQKSILITSNNSERKSQKLDRKIKVIQKEFKLQKNKLESDVKKAEKLNDKFEEEIKELKLKLKIAEEMSLKMRTLTLELDKEKEEKLCVICSVKKKYIVLQPCNHLCFCKKCYLHKTWLECPICRRHIKSTINIFT